ncbi:F-box/LRR-repeat protein At4g29420-like [Miscanthus floridulus]|uniref:F-box/LRR-repeat protein At4g29420-like n=1 Tax=Miscanthus floridulus TaxID=154761 RepID=UPI00345A2F79
MSASGDPLYALSAAVLADVLGRVADAGDIAACRLASRALLAASYLCPPASTSAPPTGAAAGARAGAVPPRSARPLRTSPRFSGVTSGPCRLTRPMGRVPPMTRCAEVAAWAATSAAAVLRELEIADYWPQACWRKAEALPLPLISHYCQNLVKLGLKNAWLSVEGLKKMPDLIHLTLEFIRLDDEDLNQLNECFPCLHTLNLIGVGGLKDPKIHLLHVKACRWEVSNVPRSLVVHAPDLVFLELKCIRPDTLILDSPSLSTLKLTIDKLGATVRVDGLLRLTNLRIESLDFSSLFPVFIDNRGIRTLELELPESASQYELLEAVNPDYLLRMLASISEVKLAPRFSCELKLCLALCKGSQFGSCLKKLLIHVPQPGSCSHLLPLFEICAPLCEVTVLFHAESADAVRQGAISVCMQNFPDIR